MNLLPTVVILRCPYLDGTWYVLAVSIRNRSDQMTNIKLIVVRLCMYFREYHSNALHSIQIAGISVFLQQLIATTTEGGQNVWDRHFFLTLKFNNLHFFHRVHKKLSNFDCLLPIIYASLVHIWALFSLSFAKLESLSLIKYYLRITNFCIFCHIFEISESNLWL